MNWVSSVALIRDCSMTWLPSSLWFTRSHVCIPAGTVTSSDWEADMCMLSRTWLMNLKTLVSRCLISMMADSSAEHTTWNEEHFYLLRHTSIGVMYSCNSSFDASWHLPLVTVEWKAVTYCVPVWVFFIAYISIHDDLRSKTS